MLQLSEPERSIIKLTARERDALLECEREVEASISEFLRCGRALARIRSGRLYRESHATFEVYCLERWGMSNSATNSLVTSFRIYEQLEAEGINVPPTATQTAMRSLQQLPAIEGLRAAAWRYGVSICPGAQCPPSSVLRKVSTILRDALDNVDGAGNPVDDEDQNEGQNQNEESESSTQGRTIGRFRTHAKKSDPDQRFLRAVTRLSAYSGFSVPLIASHVVSDKMAAYVFQSCERLKSRLDEVEQALLRQFPNAQAQAA
jgi:hypothetical protein